MTRYFYILFWLMMMMKNWVRMNLEGKKNWFFGNSTGKFISTAIQNWFCWILNIIELMFFSIRSSTIILKRHKNQKIDFVPNRSLSHWKVKNTLHSMYRYTVHCTEVILYMNLQNNLAPSKQFCGTLVKNHW